jgi:CubicO group peptidase (beta-lactamase class C family)
VKLAVIIIAAMLSTLLAAVYLFGVGVLREPFETYRWYVHSAGHRALFMCSAHYIAARAPADIVSWELRYADSDFTAPGEAVLEPSTQSAVGKTAHGLIARRAAFEAGRGCVLLPAGKSAAELPHLNLGTEGYRLERSTAPWPDGDGSDKRAAIDGAYASRLQAVVDAAFDGHTYYEPSGSWMPDTVTTGLVILYEGRIVAERYAPGWNAHTQYRAYSASKSFTNLMVGTRVLAGKLDIDAPVLFPEWQQPGDPRRVITGRHLLNMSSGLACDGGGTVSLETYFSGGRDAFTDAAERALDHPPGTVWCYSNYDALSVGRTAARSFATQREFIAHAYRTLRRLGMRDTVIETDFAGNFIMSSQIWTTPRDLARFGLLYLNDGVWQGERVLPVGWVDFTRTPVPEGAHSIRRSSTQLPTDYGAQFWLYNDRSQLPADTFTAAGHGGQFATIVPSRGVVIARLGLQGWRHKQFVADVLAALPLPEPLKRKEEAPHE